MKKLVIGILAHVDAGKTTLSEELLYLCGEIRKILFSEESQRQFTQLLGNANTTVGTLGIDFRVGALVLYHRNHKEYRHKTESRQSPCVVLFPAWITGCR